MPRRAVVRTVSGLRRFLRRRFAVDRRSLAAFRIALGLVLVVDIARRARDASAFYTDAGVLPRELLGTVAPGYEAVSLHALSGGLWLQGLLFALAALAALALLVGYRTRLAAVVSLMLLVSIQLRNPLVLNSGDVLLRRLLFWSLFLPLGSRWAVDAPGETDGEASVFGPASVGLLAQVVVVYVTNAVVKLRADVWLRGDAVRYALQLDHFTIGLGPLLAGESELLTVAAWLWLGLLLASPLLVGLTGRRRTGLVAAFLAVHAGMLLTMQLGVFPLVSMASLLPLLPGGVWDRFAAQIGPMLPEYQIDRQPLAARIPALSTAGRALASVCLVALVVVNAIGLGAVGAPAGTPEQVTERSWDMFAPSPPLETWWYVAPATLTSGERVNAITGERFDSGRPDNVATQHQNERWRKFFADARTDPRLRESLAAHLCAQWNGTHDDRMVDISLWLLTEPTDLDGSETIERQDHGHYDCDAVP